MKPLILMGDVALDLVHVIAIGAVLALCGVLAWLRGEHKRALDLTTVSLEHERDARNEAELEIGRLDQKLQTQTALAREAELRAVQAEARSAEDENKFGELAQGVLRQANSQFLQLANETFAKHKAGAKGDLEKLMEPIGESFSEFKKRIDAIEKVRAEDKSALGEQVKAISESLRHNTAETGKLVNALTAPKGGGRWGEMTLRNVMEQAGLSAHCDFAEQVNDRTETGNQRPDAVINLPGQRQIVVDSKVSLDAYLKASSTEDLAERAALLKSHAQNVQRHVKTLASKDYQSNLDDRVDFVAMFIPGENFFAAALEHNPDLLEAAYAKNVIVTTPSTLIGLAKTVSYVWRQEKMAENAREAATLGEQLYDRLVAMGGHIDKLGKSLNGAVDNYNKMNRSLETRVLPSARKFQELSIATPDKPLPEITAVETRAALPDRTGELDFEAKDDEAA